MGVSLDLHSKETGKSLVSLFRQYLHGNPAIVIIDHATFGWFFFVRIYSTVCEETIGGHEFLSLRHLVIAYTIFLKDRCSIGSI